MRTELFLSLLEPNQTIIEQTRTELNLFFNLVIRF